MPQILIFLKCQGSKFTGVHRVSCSWPLRRLQHSSLLQTVDTISVRRVRISANTTTSVTRKNVSGSRPSHRNKFTSLLGSKQPAECGVRPLRNKGVKCIRLSHTSEG